MCGGIWTRDSQSACVRLTPLPVMRASVDPWSAGTQRDSPIESVRERITTSLACAMSASLIKTTMSYVEQGTIRCLGLTENVRADGQLPYVLANLTIEETKPRVCYDCREVNDHTRDRAVTLEGLSVTRAYVCGQPTLGGVIDEKSGYSNHLVSESSSMLLGFCVLGYCFVYRTLPFGWKLGAFIHQRMGMILTGYMRFQGSRVTQYIDDRNLLARRGYELDQVDYQREVYKLLMLLLIFGYWASKAKSDLTGRTAWVTLGFVCDTRLGAFLVGSEEFGYKKRDTTIALGEAIVSGVQNANGRICWLTAAKFAGKVMSMVAAIHYIRYLLNLNYAVLAGRKVWWGETPEENKNVVPISVLEGDDILLDPGPGRDAYVREIKTILRILREGRVWPFLDSRHASICQLLTDATLDQGGGVILLTEEAKAAGIAAPWGHDEGYAFGQMLPEMLFGCHLGGINSGIGEWAGLWITCAAIDHTPHLRELFMNTIVSVKMDNMEVVCSMNSGAVGGTGTLIKNEILLAVLHYSWRWNAKFVFRHVPGIDNPADAPSRARQFRGTRLKPSTIAMLYNENPYSYFTADAMSSFATAWTPPGWEAREKPDCFLPYYSIGPDLYSSGVDCFAQNVGEVGGVPAFCYVNPPHCMLQATLQFFAESRAIALFVLPDRHREWWWTEYVSSACQWQLTLGERETQYRCKDRGWRATTTPLMLRAYILDYRSWPISRR